MTSTGTTTAAQSALSQRILDPFSRGFQAVAKKIPAPGACIPLTASSLFGPLAGAQRLDVGSVVELPTGRPAGRTPDRRFERPAVVCSRARADVAGNRPLDEKLAECPRG